MIQYQSFVPASRAARVFKMQLELARRNGLPALLGVLKRHRADPFLMSPAVDGYSLALEFKVTERNRRRLWALAAEFDALVLEAGGRLYFAKDSTLARASIAQPLSQLYKIGLGVRVKELGKKIAAENARSQRQAVVAARRSRQSPGRCVPATGWRSAERKRSRRKGSRSSPR